MDLISVIIPVYKAENSIKRCLDSIINQTYKNLEIIIVYLDDGDKTLDTIKAYNDDRIKIFIQQEKNGAGDARNIGIENSVGKYIGFVEADDYVPLDYFEKLYNEIIQNDCDISMCEITSNDTIFENPEFPNSTLLKTFKEKLRLIKCGAVFDKLFLADLIKSNNIRFPIKLVYEDNPFVLKAIYYSQKLCYIKGLYYHYLYDVSKSKEYKLRMRNSILPIAQEMYDFAVEKNFDEVEMYLLKKFILKSFVGKYIGNINICNGLSKMFHNKFWFRYRFVKWHIKKLKNKIGLRR